MTAEPSHSFEDHTSEVELQVRAATLADLFCEAGRAVAELMLGDGERAAETVVDQVVVEAPDRAALLAAWIDELVFRAETRKAVFTAFTVERMEERLIAAEIRGVAEPVIKTAVKAATFHRLRVEEEEGGWSGRVVLDV
jgi:SHS2 domain-containing protein